MRPEQADQKVANPKTQVSIRPHGESQIPKVGEAYLLASGRACGCGGTGSAACRRRGGDEVLGEERSRAAMEMARWEMLMVQHPWAVSANGNPFGPEQAALSSVMVVNNLVISHPNAPMPKQTKG